MCHDQLESSNQNPTHRKPRMAASSDIPSSSAPLSKPTQNPLGKGGFGALRRGSRPFPVTRMGSGTMSSENEEEEGELDDPVAPLGSRVEVESFRMLSRYAN